MCGEGTDTENLRDAKSLFWKVPPAPICVLVFWISLWPGSPNCVWRYYFERNSRGRGFTAAREDTCVTLYKKCWVNVVDVVAEAWILGFRPGFESWVIHSTGMDLVPTVCWALGVRWLTKPVWPLPHGVLQSGVSGGRGWQGETSLGILFTGSVTLKVPSRLCASVFSSKKWTHITCYYRDYSEASLLKH